MTARLARHDFFRPALLLGAARVAGAGVVAHAGLARAASGGGQALVAFLSRTGYTRVVAGQIARARQADVFEIETAQPYPADYPQPVAQAARDTEAGFEPPLKAAVPALGRYATVFPGFPAWG